MSFAPSERGTPAADGEPVGPTPLDADAELRELLLDGADAIALLDDELGGVADVGDAVGERGGNRERRNLVDDVRDLVALDRGGAERRRVDVQLADRFAAGLARRAQLDVGTRAATKPTRASDWTRRRRGRGSDPGVIAAATAKNAADDGSPGTSISNALGDARRTRTTGPSYSIGAPSAPAQHALGVIAAMARRPDPVTPSAWSPASTSADLTCASRDRELVTLRPQGSPVDRKRRPVAVVAAVDDRTHRGRSGSTTRAIGRCRSESSPLSTERNGRPASVPDSTRIVVPLFSQSRTLPGSDQLSMPFLHDHGAAATFHAHTEVFSAAPVAADIGAGREMGDRAPPRPRRAPRTPARGARSTCRRETEPPADACAPPRTSSVGIRSHESSDRDAEIAESFVQRSLERIGAPMRRRP